MEKLAESVANSIKELQKIPVADLYEKRAEKFIAMTRDIKFSKQTE